MYKWPHVWSIVAASKSNDYTHTTSPRLDIILRAWKGPGPQLFVIFLYVINTSAIHILRYVLTDTAGVLEK